jgi:outer membrane receptor protein involved in Fe transport
MLFIDPNDHARKGEKKMNTVSRWSLLATSALVLPTAALAQQAPPALEEIIVTAQKREERLTDVPSSVTALQGNALTERGALRFEDYQAYVPGLSTISIAPGYSQIQIRGVSTGINQLSATVGTYFDDAPTNSSTANGLGNRLTPDPDLLDVKRIEVLRGPQGTLYGANALGGVIRYVLESPSLTGSTGRLEVGVSSIEHGGVGNITRGAYSAPLIDGKLGVRLSGFYSNDPGYIDNVMTGHDNVNKSINFGGRVAMLWQVAPDFSASWSSLYQRRRNDGLPAETNVTPSMKPTDGEYNQAVATDEFTETTYQLHSLTLNADLDFADLISATSFGRQQTELASDATPLYGTLLGLPGVSLPFANNLDKFTQEIRLVSPTHRLFEYIAGGYFTKENVSNDTGATAFLAPGVPAPAPINPLLAATIESEYKEIAGFANGTLNFSDRFDIQIGGRYSHNHQKFREVLGGALAGPLAGSMFSGTSGENATTFAISPQYWITRELNVYARVASGFRPGGTNLVPPGGGGIVSPTYGSDTLVNYEAGVKATLLDHRLEFTLDAFRIDWKDIQTTASASGFNYLVNGGRARSRGVEGDAHWTQGRLRLGGNFSYIKATTLDPIAQVGAQSGDDLPYSPRWAGALTLDYAFPLKADWAATVGTSVRYTGERQAYYSLATASNPGNLELDAMTTLDLRAGLTHGRYSVNLIVQNVTDERHIVAAETDAANPFTGAGARATIARPRTIGLTLGVDF